MRGTAPGGRAPRPPRIRAVVVDIDGTVTDAQRRLEPRVMAALRRIESRGRPVILATGNVFPIALAVERFVGLTGPIIAENGGLLYRRERGRDRMFRLADRRVALRAFAALRRAGIPARRLFTDRWRETEVGLEPSISVRRARRALAGHPVDVIPTGYAIHLIERGRGKLEALERALRPYGLAPEDCLVAGDGDNDVPMLRAAGWAVSFRSASAGARRAADYVARARYAPGLLEALKRAGLLPATRALE